MKNDDNKSDDEKSCDSPKSFHTSYTGWTLSTIETQIRVETMVTQMSTMQQMILLRIILTNAKHP